MSYPLAVCITLVCAYLLGSIPCGVIIGRVFFGADPRDGGSGSIGATNMNRMFGWKAGIGAFAGDVAKGALAVAVARALMWACDVSGGWQFDLCLVLGVFGSIFGHMFSPWLRFKGGKGISTGLGSILVAFPLVAVTILAVFAVVAGATKMVSAGSIAAAVAFPVASCIFHFGSVPVIAFSLVVAVGVVFAHRSNIKRIAEGTEPKFSINRSQG